MRRDLPLGFRDAHDLHAGYAIGRMAGAAGPEFPHAIILSIPDEKTLLEWSDKLAALSIRHELIREPDPPWNGQATILACYPVRKSLLRRYLSSLPLLKERRNGSPG